MKLFRRIISVVVSLSIILSTTALAATVPNSNTSAKVNVISSSTNTNTMREISETSVSTIYFVDTPDYTVTLEIPFDEENLSTAYYKDKATMTLSTYKDISRELSVDDIVRMVSLQELSTDDITPITVVATTRSMSDDEIANCIGKKLEADFGTQYVDKALASITRDGYDADLYGTMVFQMYKDFSILVPARLAVSAIAALTSWPTKLIQQVCNVMKLSNGVIGVVEEFMANEYSADVVYDKSAYVNNECTYSVGRTVYHTAYVGDKDCALVYDKTLSTSSDFDHDFDILEKAIDNYDTYWK